MTLPLRGLFTVLPTPFDDQDRIDQADFLSVLAFVRKSGVDGVVFPGFASEVHMLSVEERQRFVDLLGHQLKGELPFVVGASDPDPEVAASRAAEGAAAGAVAAMVAAPPGLGADLDAQTGFFSRLAAAADIGIMLQNAPQPQGAALSPALVARLVEAVPQIRWVKEETLPCGQNVALIHQAVGDRLEGVFGGAGARYVIDELVRGGAGSMPATELADLHAHLLAAWRAGDQVKARQLYMWSLPLLSQQAVFRWHVTKEVLRLRGIIRHTRVRAAGPAPDQRDRAELATLLDLLRPQLDPEPTP